MLVDDGLAMIADTRTNAGVDNISSYRKLHVFEKPGERVLAGLHFDRVLGVKASKVRQDSPDAVVQLLALHFEPKGDVAGTVEFLLAGGGRIRLEVECIDAQLRDLSESWPASARPKHGLEET